MRTMRTMEPSWQATVHPSIITAVRYKAFIYPTPAEIPMPATYLNLLEAHGPIAEGNPPRVFHAP